MESLLSMVLLMRSQDETPVIPDEILFKDPTQLEALECLCHHKYPIHLQLAQRLFGPPRISLSWKQRCHLFQLLAKFDTLTALTIQGTTMGQVISSELLSTGIPSSLCSLTIQVGLIFDQLTSVEKLATAIKDHPNLQEIRLHNFLNHVRPFQEPHTRLLDSLVQSLSTCSKLKVVELSCLASFLEWRVPLISCNALQHLLSTPNTQIQRLQLTNLGLADQEFEIIAEIRPASLQQLILNANENTIVGLRRLLLKCLSIGSTITHLETMNHVKLTEDLYEYIVWYTERYTCPLQSLEVTFPLRIDPTVLRLQLRLHRLDLSSRFYSPKATLSTKLQVLGQVSDDPNGIFRLLREQPSLMEGSVNRSKNVHPRSASPSSTFATATTTTTATTTAMSNITSASTNRKHSSIAIPKASRTSKSRNNWCSLKAMFVISILVLLLLPVSGPRPAFSRMKSRKPPELLFTTVFTFIRTRQPP